MRTPNTNCSICEKPLYRRPSEFEVGKQFCCKGCRSELYKRKPSIWKKNLQKGWAWNKGLSKENGDELVYGRPRSEQTKRKISKALLGRPFSEEHREKLAKAMVERRGLQRKRDTNIERVLEEWLVDNDIEFEKHKAVEGISNPDFFILPNICLYADGDYWHNLETVKKRDKRINSQLTKQGYTVIRLWGSDIQNGVRPNEILQEA